MRPDMINESFTLCIIRIKNFIKSKVIFASSIFILASCNPAYLVPLPRPCDQPGYMTGIFIVDKKIHNPRVLKALLSRNIKHLKDLEITEDQIKSALRLNGATCKLKECNLLFFSFHGSSSALLYRQNYYTQILKVSFEKGLKAERFMISSVKADIRKTHIVLKPYNNRSWLRDNLTVKKSNFVPIQFHFQECAPEYDGTYSDIDLLTNYVRNAQEIGY